MPQGRSVRLPDEGSLSDDEFKLGWKRKPSLTAERVMDRSKYQTFLACPAAAAVAAATIRVLPSLFYMQPKIVSVATEQ